MSNSPYRPDPSQADPYVSDPYVTDPSATQSTEPVGSTYPATEAYPASGYYATTESSSTSVGDQSGGDASTKDVAKEQAAEVKDTAVDAGKNVAGTVKQEAQNVTAEAGAQAKSLLSSATSELKSQASTQQSRFASTLSGYSDELHGLVSGNGQGGPLTDLVHQAAQKSSEISSWLENKEPADVLDEVRRFARRRPLAFLGLCALAGIAAGRVTRGAVAANTEVDSPRSTGGNTAALGSGPAYEPATYQPAHAYTPATDYATTGYAEPVAPVETGLTAGTTWNDPTGAGQPQTGPGGAIR
jgi:hypothetical protein